MHNNHTHAVNKPNLNLRVLDILFVGYIIRPM